MEICSLLRLNARNKFYFSLFIGLMSLLPALTFAGQYETARAIEYYENGEYRRAKSILSNTDISDDPVAFYMMGAIALKDVESGNRNSNLNTAIKWFEQSAALNYPQAYHALGRTYEQRWLNQRNLDDYEKSKINYELAISSDIEMAKSDLASLVSRPAPDLDEEDEQRRVEINSKTYPVTNTSRLAKPEPAAEPGQSSTDGSVAAAPGDTESSRETRSTKWEVRPYIGVTGNVFTISGSDFSGRDVTTNFSVSVPGDSSDKGSAAGLTGGILISESNKVGFSYFSGKEDDSSIMTLTVASIFFDHSFNNSGVHRGFFLGGGASYVEIETDKTSLTSAAKVDGSGLLLRAGYEYLFDSPLYLELGFDYPVFELDQKILGTGANSDIEISSKMQSSNIYLSLSYVF